MLCCSHSFFRCSCRSYKVPLVVCFLGIWACRLPFHRQAHFTENCLPSIKWRVWLEPHPLNTTCLRRIVSGLLAGRSCWVCAACMHMYKAQESIFLSGRPRIALFSVCSSWSCIFCVFRRREKLLFLPVSYCLCRCGVVCVSACVCVCSCRVNMYIARFCYSRQG